MAADSQPDAAQTTAITRRRSVGLAVVVCTVGFTCYLLILSLGVYSTESIGWGDGRTFSVYSQRYHAGTPAWLTYNDVSSSGDVPPLPQPERAAPGFHVNWGLLGIAAIPAVFIAIILSFAVVPLFKRIPPVRLSAALLVTLLAMIVAGLAGYYALQEDAPPVETFIPYFMVPITVVIASCLFRDYFLGLIVSAFAILTVWWGFRVSCVLREPFRDVQPPEIYWSVDGTALAIGTGVLALIASASVFVCRAISKKRFGT